MIVKGDSMVQESVGFRIKDLRKQKGYTLKILSEKAKISVSFLSDIENNRSKPSLERLKEIADALETTSSYLLGEANHNLPNSFDVQRSRKETESLSEEFTDMLIRRGKIKNKKDLTTQNVLKFLNEIIEELDKE